MVSSLDVDQRKQASRHIKATFDWLEDRETAWEDLIRLAQDDDSVVRWSATDALGSIFSQVPDKDQAWEDLHRLAQDDDRVVRSHAAGALRSVFSIVPDKDQAWVDLHRLAQDDDSVVRSSAANAIRSVFKMVPDRDQAWKDLTRLAQDDDSGVRSRAAGALQSVSSLVPDRDQAWKDLIRLAQDDYSLVQLRAAYALRSVFSQVPDKDQAWKDLIRLAQDDDSDVGYNAIIALGSVFNLVQEKVQAWKDLHRLAQDDDSDVRSSVAYSLGSVFGLVPSKDQAWEDLHRLAQDDDSDVRSSAAHSLGSVFGLVPSKDQAWDDLQRLAQDDDRSVRFSVAYALGFVFSLVPDKDQAWEDLHGLVQDVNKDVRSGAAYALGSVFSLVPDKAQACEDLHRLAQDDDSDVRSSAAGAIRSVFSLVPDKDQAWEDLHRLAQDDDRHVRSRAAYALGSVFNLVQDDAQACDDLQRLAQDDDQEVRCASYHSLGRASIFKATESDDEFRFYLEEAIDFFSRSSQEAKYSNPASFCLPFYRSLHALLFTEILKEDEVQKYMVDAKKAIEASESREVLLEAVNNLSKALQEVRAYSFEDILLKKRDLKSYTKYCLQTAECLREARAKAPFASKIIDYTLIEKSIPIVDNKIKALFREVEAAAGRLCNSARGTELEAFGRDAYESTRGLNQVDSWIKADRYLEEIVPLLKTHCIRLPRDAQEYLKTLIDSQDTASLQQRLDTLKSVLIASLVQGENDDQSIRELKGILDLHLENIEFAILNMKINSGKAGKELYSLKNQIDGLQKQIESQGLGGKELADSLEKRDRAMIDRLEGVRETLFQAVRDVAHHSASKTDAETILKKLEDQDRFKKKDILGIIADISSLAGMALGFYL